MRDSKEVTPWAVRRSSIVRWSRGRGRLLVGDGGRGCGGGGGAWAVLFGWLAAGRVCDCEGGCWDCVLLSEDGGTPFVRGPLVAILRVMRGRSCDVGRWAAGPRDGGLMMDASASRDVGCSIPAFRGRSE